MSRKFDLSQKLKFAVASSTLTTGAWATKFPIILAENEIGLVHAAKSTVYRDAAGSYKARLFLYRKTENVPETAAWTDHSDGGWLKDKAVLDAWFYFGNTLRTVESLAPIPMLYQNYPIPLVLIRTPTMVHYGTAGTSGSITLFYTTQKVSDKDLAELMMKDHA